MYTGTEKILVVDDDDQLKAVKKALPFFLKTNLIWS